MIWGDHPPRRRPTRPVPTWDSPQALIAAVIWLVIVLVLAPWAIDREAETHPTPPAQLRAITDR